MASKEVKSPSAFELTHSAMPRQTLVFREESQRVDLAIYVIIIL
jgi:hypothetical protein